MDRIFSAFLDAQYEQGMALASANDLLELLVAVDTVPPQRYLALFHCTGLVCSEQGEVSEAQGFVVGIWFPDDYLRRVEPAQVLTWMGPSNVWHPNLLAPYICVGRLTPGTSLVDLLDQIFLIITYNKVTMREDDALNKPACAWARQNQERFPLDRRPLKRPKCDLRVEALREEK